MEKFLIIDTETTNSLDDPLCYDIGFAVIDKNAKVYEAHSYVVADIFLDKELMSTAYFIEKVPQYWEDIKNGKRILRRLKTIRFIISDICKQYGITKVFAHNAKFDSLSLNLTQRFLTSSKYRYFLPWGIEWWDTLKMSRKILKKNDDYKSFCHENGYLTSRNQCRYTAEILYRYITGDNNFVESHTGLEDVLIEKEILRFCLETDCRINGRLWE